MRVELLCREVLFEAWFHQKGDTIISLSAHHQRTVRVMRACRHCHVVGHHAVAEARVGANRHPVPDHGVDERRIRRDDVPSPRSSGRPSRVAILIAVSR